MTLKHRISNCWKSSNSCFYCCFEALFVSHQLILSTFQPDIWSNKFLWSVQSIYTVSSTCKRIFCAVNVFFQCGNAVTQNVNSFETQWSKPTLKFIQRVKKFRVSWFLIFIYWQYIPKMSKTSFRTLFMLPKWHIELLQQNNWITL